MNTETPGASTTPRMPGASSWALIALMRPGTAAPGTAAGAVQYGNAEFTPGRRSVMKPVMLFWYRSTVTYTFSLSAPL